MDFIYSFGVILVFLCQIFELGLENGKHFLKLSKLAQNDQDGLLGPDFGYFIPEKVTKNSQIYTLVCIKALEYEKFQFYVRTAWKTQNEIIELEIRPQETSRKSVKLLEFSFPKFFFQRNYLQSSACK